jgi:hypothetical protein
MILIILKTKMRTYLIILVIILTSCGTFKSTKVELQFSNDLVMNSLYDYSNSMAKTYPKKSIFDVVVDSLTDKLQVYIFLSDTRYFYKDENTLLQ